MTRITAREPYGRDGEEPSLLELRTCDQEQEVDDRCKAEFLGDERGGVFES